MMRSRYSRLVSDDRFSPLLSAIIESFSCQSDEMRGKTLLVFTLSSNGGVFFITEKCIGSRTN